MTYKNIPVSEETHEKVKALATSRGRTLGGQIDFWMSLDQVALERLGISMIDILPHPVDAVPVPVVLTKHSLIAEQEARQGADESLREEVERRR